MTSQPKVVVVMPAYNAGRTLRLTYEELPKESVNLVILVDDGSNDQTLEIARELGLEIFVHDKNYGYGANQKTCYTEALKAGADIVVMVHPDYQYDPTLVPKMIEPIVRGEADLVLGSRLKGGGSAIAQGMPWWKYVSNRFLTGVENVSFGLALSEYHTGYRAFSREVLDAVNFRMNSDGFVFDQEIIAQCVTARFASRESPCRCAYFPEASSASFFASSGYGLKILWGDRYPLHAPAQALTAAARTCAGGTAARSRVRDVRSQLSPVRFSTWPLSPAAWPSSRRSSTGGGAPRSSSSSAGVLALRLADRAVPVAVRRDPAAWSSSARRLRGLDSFITLTEGPDPAHAALELGS
jgi:hypothetical protein